MKIKPIELDYLTQKDLSAFEDAIYNKINEIVEVVNSVPRLSSGGYLRICLNCGKQFSTNNPDANYCGCKLPFCVETNN